MKTNHSLEQILSTLESAKSLVVVSHYNPDADAYGSSLGLTLALRAWGKKVYCVNESGILKRYSFIPGVDQVLSTFPKEDCDALVVCDCGEGKRVGDNLFKQLNRFTTIINIDHHISNDFFGSLNYIDDKASSTAELIYKLLGKSTWNMSPEVATCLMAGLVADTGSFRYSNTNAETFAIAESLVRHGAKPYEINQALFSSERLAAVRLKAKALAEVKLHCENKIAELLVTHDTFKTLGASSDDTEGLVENARDIEGVLLAVLIYPDADIWRVSLRAKHTDLDVAAVAASFGGGGHRMAAGFRVRHKLEEFRPRLLAALEAAVHELGAHSQ